MKLWPQSCNAVICIHNSMYKTVHNRHEGPVIGGVVLQAGPGHHNHEGVMVHVEERHLVVFLSDDEEYCV
jgi:hypothetical protein